MPRSGFEFDEAAGALCDVRWKVSALRALDFDFGCISRRGFQILGRVGGLQASTFCRVADSLIHCVPNVNWMGEWVNRCLRLPLAQGCNMSPQLVKTRWNEQNPKKKTQNKVDREWERGGGQQKERNSDGICGKKRSENQDRESARPFTARLSFSVGNEASSNSRILPASLHLSSKTERRIQADFQRIWRIWARIRAGFFEIFCDSLTTSLQDSWKILQRFPANFLNQTGDLYWIDSYIYLCWKMNFSFFIKEWTTLLHFSSFAIIIVLFSLLLFLFFLFNFCFAFCFFFFVFQIFNFCVDPLLL